MKTLAAIAGLSALLSVCQPSQVPDVTGLPCQQWAAPALAAGWQPDELPRLLPIIWRESRCDPGVVRYNKRTGRPIDVGLTQINQVHRGELARRGFDHLDMRDPNANLWFAKWLHTWHEDRGLCGLAPWRGRC
jgi:hypothetical protein